MTAKVKRNSNGKLEDQMNWGKTVLSIQLMQMNGQSGAVP